MDLRTLARARRRLRSTARNALELLRFGRLGDDYGAAYDVVDQGVIYRLRRYPLPEGVTEKSSVLLVPPLMVTADVYDVAPDVSAVAALGALGISVFVVDFGAPEREEGGMQRTQADHVHAVVLAIERVRALTGRDVHVGGYSQGGMFAYQAAAFLRSRGLASIISFGSPVDVHKNLPALRGELTGALAELVEPAVGRLVERLEGLPGALTSTAFKLLSTRKEIEQRIEFVRMLHDRKALIRREARRRFLGGGGFVAWPGPAFREFASDFVVHNRMLSGGFVIDGRTLTLADITCPVLCFWGSADEIASPASVHAIERAAPHAAVSFVEVRAGHFGIVVGSRALAKTWPTVAGWLLHREGHGPLPDALVDAQRAPVDYDLDSSEVDVDFDLFVGTFGAAAKDAWRRVGDVAASATDAIDALRYQEPRLRRLAEIGPGTPISPARALAEQAARSPSSTFFLWRGRAFSYRDADARVTNVARGLWASGVRAGDRVLVVMRSRPSLLTMVTALSRIGAAPLVAPPEASGRALLHAAEALGAKAVATDPENGPAVCAALGRSVLVLGGGGGPRVLAAGLIDMEAIDPATIELPASATESIGFARELAMVLLRPGDDGLLRAAHVTNHRWALSALGAAAACTLKPGDTVYSCIPLHHPTALLACVGAAIVAGTRLALAETFDAETLLPETRRAGATVVFYAGEMLRALLAREPSSADRSLPIRLFAGSGLRADLARRLRDRFGARAIEFYASTSLRVVLANPSGDKPGALGRPLPGSADVMLVRCDLAQKTALRDAGGRFEAARDGEPGLLAVRGDGDGAWVATRDVVRRDEDGDFWFVDALSGFAQCAGGPASLRALEDAFYTLPEITMAAAFEHEGAVCACYSSPEPVSRARLDDALAHVAARPTTVARVAEIPLTEGFRPDRGRLVALCANSAERIELPFDR